MLIAGFIALGFYSVSYYYSNYLIVLVRSTMFSCYELLLVLYWNLGLCGTVYFYC